MARKYSFDMEDTKPYENPEFAGLPQQKYEPTFGTSDNGNKEKATDDASKKLHFGPDVRIRDSPYRYSSDQDYLSPNFQRHSTPTHPSTATEFNPYRKPPEYDGTTSFKDYSVQFNLIAELNNWNKRRSALELAASLNGAARELLSDLAPYERTDFDILVTALKNRFEPDSQQDVYRFQLKQKLRQKGESLPDLAHEIKKLVRKANPTATALMRESLAKDAFIDALNDRDLQWAVHQGQPDSVDEAVATAIQYEAIHTKTETLNRPPTDYSKDTEIDRLTKQFEVMMGKMDNMQNQHNYRQNFNRSPAPKPYSTSPQNANKDKKSVNWADNKPQYSSNRFKNKPFTPGPCWNCGEMGHHRMSCPRGNNNQYNRPGNRQ